MNVLSLFGGIETGLIALKELGVKIDNYYSSEIDKYAVSVAKYNHPEIQHLGSIEDYESWDLPRIDLIMAGFPCQSFSLIGKQLNFKDESGQLFFKAVEILWKVQETNPSVKFLFENVKMKKEFKNAISEIMEREPVLINSAMVSAQNRARLYWCNLEVDQPNDKGILLKDVIESGYVDRDKSLCVQSHWSRTRDNKSYYIRYIEKSFEQIIFNDEAQLILSKINKSDVKTFIERKKDGLLDQDYQRLIRKLTPVECERLQTLPDNYTLNGTDNKGNTTNISNPQRYKMVGNGWTKDVIKHILSCM